MVLDSPINSEGRFSLYHLRAGPVELAIAQSLFDAALAETEAVIEPGEDASAGSRRRPLRVDLDPWDLRADLRGVEFAIEYPPGVVKSAIVLCGETMFFGAGQNFAGLVPTSESDIEVRANGCQVVAIGIDALPQTVVLEPALQCVLELKRIPFEAGNLMVGLERMEQAQLSSPEGSGLPPIDMRPVAKATVVDGAGRATLQVTESGRFRLGWRTKKDGVFVPLEVGDLPASMIDLVIDITESNEVQSFSFDLGG